ncbi:MAG TPA: ArsA-related P-loop ATPase [Vicinamibacteria bacterium]|nr:ArsA-related P-loop ATPase [Vicinamibacteria bacterium]
MFVDELLSRRLIVLSGKGGVGKSVVGGALALAARRRGRRVLLVEIDAPLTATRYLGGAPADHEPVEAVPGVWTVNLRPPRVMDEYVRETVRIDLLVRRILESPVYHRFFSAAPGLAELMVLGKIMVLEEDRVGFPRRPRWDHVIVDLPATGHGLAFLKVPLAASRAVPVGPVGHNARRILSLVRDPRRTALVVVAIPEEMAVVEALELRAAMEAELGVSPVGLVLNGCHERRFTAAEEDEVQRLSTEGAAGRLPEGGSLAAALAAARREIRRRKRAHHYLKRLRAEAAEPVVTLPFLFDEVIGKDALQQLADRLEAA